MDTFFYTNAKNWTEKSQKDLINKNYSDSWAKTLPAKVNYLADAIVNVAFTPFSLLKTFFAAIKYAYTWGKEAEDLKNSVKELTSHINHTLSDFAGILATKAGVTLRDKNNLDSVIGLTLVIGAVGLFVLAISNASGVKLAYNLNTGMMDPSLYWKF